MNKAVNQMGGYGSDSAFYGGFSPIVGLCQSGTSKCVSRVPAWFGDNSFTLGRFLAWCGVIALIVGFMTLEGTFGGSFGDFSALLGFVNGGNSGFLGISWDFSVISLRSGELLTMPDAISYNVATSHAWVLTAAALAASVASSIFGGAKAKEAAKRQEQQLQDEKAKEDAILSRKRNEAYADTAAGQRLLTQAREFNKENWRRAQGAAKIGNASDASVAMAKEAGNKMMANTLGNMAANDTARKDAADQQQIESDRNYANKQMAIEQYKAEQTQQAASQASNALMSAAASFDDGGIGGKKGGLAANTGGNGTLADNYAKFQENIKKKMPWQQ